MMKKQIYALLLTIGSIISIHTQASEMSTQTQIAKTANIWIDVRTAKEYEEGHLENAINIPVEKITQEISKVTTDKSTPINLYCRSGRRADVAMKELQQLGFTNVTNHGGYQDLLNKGMK